MSQVRVGGLERHRIAQARRGGDALVGFGESHGLQDRDPGVPQQFCRLVRGQCVEPVPGDLGLELFEELLDGVVIEVLGDRHAPVFLIAPIRVGDHTRQCE